MANTQIEWLEKNISNGSIENIEYNKFVNRKKIGTGGFGDVFSYDMKDSELVVVLKCLKSEEIFEDFINELTILKICDNPNIIKFYGVTKDSNERYYMVLQYADGGNLRNYLESKKPRWTDKLSIAKEIACGLSYLHDNNIIHKDLHPKNILIHQGKPKIADFGLSKQINEVPIASNSNFKEDIKGVLEYTEPQCIIDDKYKCNEKSDVYSFGVILWEISSGIPPFQKIQTQLRISVHICRGNREDPIEGTPPPYIELYNKCWDNNPANRPETKIIHDTLNQIILDEERIKTGLGQLKGTQQIELEMNRGEMLAQIGELQNQYLKEFNEDNEFKEALELYVEPRGTWSVPIINEKNEKEIKEKEGVVKKVVTDFLTSKDKLTSDDKENLENEANTFLCSQKTELLINKVNSFFKPENQLTLEDINVLKVAANQFLALKDKKALKLLEIAINQYLESSKDERVLKNAICNFLESPYVLESKLSKENKLVLGQQITAEDAKVLENASKKKDKEDFEKTAKEFLTLKAKEILETAINKLLNLKRKKVLLLLGSGGTGKSTFNHHLACQLWNQYNQQEVTQPIPLFITLAPLKALINQNKDFIGAYLQQAGNLTKDEINKLRERKFVFILDGYDEISERERQCYNSNLFSEWKNAKIIISCRPEYLDEGYEKKFWPKENGERGFQELTLTPFSEVEIEQYIRKYCDYSKKKGSLLPWSADAYLQQIKNIPQVNDLVSNPILLKITLSVLPGLLEIGSQISRIMLYDEFIKKWFERAQNRLQKIQLKPNEQKEFNRLKNNDFYKEYLQFSKEFAFKMFIDNNKVIVSYDPMNEKIASDWDKFLGATDEKCRLMRFSMPLFRRGNQYWFFHKSLRDFLISCALVDSFKDTAQTTLLNKQSITPEPAIQEFLAERVQQMPEHVQPLSNFIEYSKLNDNIQIASANAITILSRAKIQLSKNLNNIRVSGADLSNGIFNNYQLARAKLDNVNFQNANLASADLTSADLQNANFQNANFQNANLQNVNLQNAKLPSSSLRYANFKDANLSYVNLYDMNSSNGLSWLGQCYDLGIGVEIDKCKAFTYYLKAAEAGNFMGIWETSICYKYGIGIEQNINKYNEWIEK
ncbi:NACHT domain-containing protein [Gigaspora margarita]|uniref:NACHT domain-containing protein n=1 Tax=Gigaspora margarita TaxID=4874 RepID=A0A8H4ACJ4_GIGMA|nr:NACHT domain-containing protein [Gigaspora margarita]